MNKVSNIYILLSLPLSSHLSFSLSLTSPLSLQSSPGHRQVSTLAEPSHPGKDRGKRPLSLLFHPFLSSSLSHSLSSLTLTLYLSSLIRRRAAGHGDAL